MSGPEAAGIRVLLVDDDDTFREVMSAELVRRGYAVRTAASGSAALEPAAVAGADVVLLDLRLPDLDGIEVLKAFRERDAQAGVVVLTGHGTIDTAIKAIRLGAYDFLEKPCPIDEVEMAIQRTQEHLRLVERQRVLEDGYTPRDVQGEFIGASPAFEKLRSTIERIAKVDSATLILGETGAGKDLVAKLLHAGSPRREKPFVVVDCASLHEDLLQSELFGHEKGAFTGAHRQRHGLFEVAHRGTIFLDEVGELSLDVQAKLLRVLETGSFRRLGGTAELHVDVRVLSATNRDLQAAVALGIFRGDLFFRLATLSVEVPALRERREDIPKLVEHFTERFKLRYSVAKRFGSEARKSLERYAWPGNVRELAHVVEQALVLAEGEVVGPECLPAAFREAPAGDGLIALGEMERRHVLSVLERMAGNRAQAARVLQISERNLYRLLRKYGAAPPT